MLESSSSLDNLEWAGVGQNAFLSKYGFQQCHYSLYQSLGVMQTVVLMELYAKRRLLMSVGKLQNDGSFFYISEHIENKLNISKHEKMKYQKDLIKIGAIKVVKKGMPSKNFFFIDDKKILLELMAHGDKKLDRLTSKELPKGSDNHSSRKYRLQEVENIDLRSRKYRPQVVENIDTNNSIYNNSINNKREREEELIDSKSIVSSELPPSPILENSEKNKTSTIDSNAIKNETCTNTSNDIKNANTGKESRQKNDKKKITPDQLQNLYNNRIARFNNKFCQLFSSIAISNLIVLFGYKQFNTLEKWDDIFTKVLNSSDFLLKNFDSSWLSDENKMIKVINGSYDNNFNKNEKKEKVKEYFGTSNVFNDIPAPAVKYTFTSEKMNNKKKNKAFNNKKSTNKNVWLSDCLSKLTSSR